MLFNDENHVKNLPDAYAKTNDSNNYKILETERQTLKTIREIIKDVDDCLDLDKAYGKTLDYYGEKVGQVRGVATDEQYRVMIRSKITQNLSDGTHKSVVRSICATFNCDSSDVLIRDNDNTCVIDVVKLPLEAIVKSNFTANQTVAIIKRLLPVCITIDSYLFEGTFEFSESEAEYDATAGFCDVEGGTLGGYLGVTQGDNDDTILPI